MLPHAYWRIPTSFHWRTAICMDDSADKVTHAGLSEEHISCFSSQGIKQQSQTNADT